MSSSTMPPPSRSSSSFVAKPARGFQVLRIDGYSSTKELPAGERITSDIFTVGGRNWSVDYYPNGTDASTDDGSGAIALYLRLICNTPSGGSFPYHYQQFKERSRARYKFSLLDLTTGDATFERPEETGVFTFASGHQPAYAGGQQVAGGGDVGCGHAAFITRQELEGLIKEDRLAIRCDVSVTEVSPLPLAVPNPNPLPLPATRPRFSSYGLGRFDDGANELGYLGLGEYSRRLDDYYLGGPSRRSQQSQELPQDGDDKEYIRRCLADGNRPRE